MLRESKLGLLLVVLFAGSMWFYVRCVLVPYQRTDAAAHGRPRGNLSDLYPRWLGARELLIDHRDPYSSAVTREIQTGYYGRPLDPSLPDDPKDQQGFVYPVYVSFLLAPVLKVPFSVLQVGFRWFLFVLTALTVPLWLRAAGLRVQPIVSLALTLLTLGSFPAAQGIELQQLTLVVAALIAGAMVLLLGNQFFLAGILLALATIKPQLSLPLAAWLIVWAASGWRERHKFIYGFALTMLALCMGGEMVLPGWFWRFLHATQEYRQYTGSKSILEMLTNHIAGMAISLMASAAVVYFCGRSRREICNSIYFRLSFSMVLAATILIIPTFAPYNQLLLLPAIFLLAENRRKLFASVIGIRLIWIVAGIVIGWPWMTALGLAVASLFFPAFQVQRAWATPLYTSIAIPLAVSGLLIQYALKVLQRQRSASHSWAESNRIL